jgi:hypothetical protein
MSISMKFNKDILVTKPELVVMWCNKMESVKNWISVLYVK